VSIFSKKYWNVPNTSSLFISPDSAMNAIFGGRIGKILQVEEVFDSRKENSKLAQKFGTFQFSREKTHRRGI
jgi:hypothetical protein